MSWLDKYMPQNLEDIIGNKNAIYKLQMWLNSFINEKINGITFGKKIHHCCMIYGPIGIGKTLTIKLLAKKYGFELITIDASDDRQQKRKKNEMDIFESVGKLIKPPPNAFSQHNVPKIICVEEINSALSNAKCKKELKRFLPLLERSRYPLICICNERGEDGIAPMRKSCILVPFEHPLENQIKQFYASILIRENKMDNGIIDYIYFEAKSDIRRGLIMLQYYTSTQHVLNAQNVNNFQNDDMHVYLQNFGTKSIYKSFMDYLSRDTNYSIYTSKLLCHCMTVADTLISVTNDIKLLSEYYDTDRDIENIANYLSFKGLYNIIYKQKQCNCEPPDQRDITLRYPSYLNSVFDRMKCLAKFTPLPNSFIVPKENFPLEILTFLKRIICTIMIDNPNIEQVIKLFNYYGLYVTDYKILRKYGLFPGEFESIPILSKEMTELLPNYVKKKKK